MRDTEKQHFLNLMRQERVVPCHLDRLGLSASDPKELLARLSCEEFTQLVAEIRAGHPRAPRMTPAGS